MFKTHLLLVVCSLGVVSAGRWKDVFKARGGGEDKNGKCEVSERPSDFTVSWTATIDLADANAPRIWLDGTGDSDPATTGSCTWVHDTADPDYTPDWPNYYDGTCDGGDNNGDACKTDGDHCGTGTCVANDWFKITGNDGTCDGGDNNGDACQTNGDHCGTGTCVANGGEWHCGTCAHDDDGKNNGGNCAADRGCPICAGTWDGIAGTCDPDGIGPIDPSSSWPTATCNAPTKPTCPSWEGDYSTSVSIGADATPRATSGLFFIVEPDYSTDHTVPEDTIEAALVNVALVCDGQGENVGYGIECTVNADCGAGGACITKYTTTIPTAVQWECTDTTDCTDAAEPVCATRTVDSEVWSLGFDPALCSTFQGYKYYFQGNNKPRSGETCVVKDADKIEINSAEDTLLCPEAFTVVRQGGASTKDSSKSPAQGGAGCTSDNTHPFLMATCPVNVKYEAPGAGTGGKSTRK